MLAGDSGNKEQGMTEGEYIIGIAGMFAAMLSFGVSRDVGIDKNFLRPLLIGNAAISGLAALPSAASFRGGLFLAVLAIGATEAGYWFGRGLAAMLGPRTSGEPWGWGTDKPGCLIAIALGIGLLIVMGAHNTGE